MSRRYFREAPTSRANARAWHWADDAACAGMDLGLFYGHDYERQEARTKREAKALAVCAGCPVRSACREAAVQYSPSKQYGVQGGLTAEERVVIRRNRLRHAAAERAA